MPINVSFDSWHHSDDSVYIDINDQHVSIKDFNKKDFKYTSTSHIIIQSRLYKLTIKPFHFSIAINLNIYSFISDDEFALYCKYENIEISDESRKAFCLMTFTKYSKLEISEMRGYLDRWGSPIPKEYIVNNEENAFKNIGIKTHGSKIRGESGLFIYNIDDGQYIVRFKEIREPSVRLYDTLSSQQCVMSNPELSDSVRALYEKLESELYVGLHTKDWYHPDIEGQEILDELLKEFVERSDGFAYIGWRNLYGMTDHINDFVNNLRELGYEPAPIREYISSLPMLKYSMSKSAR